MGKGHNYWGEAADPETEGAKIKAQKEMQKALMSNSYGFTAVKVAGSEEVAIKEAKDAEAEAYSWAFNHFSNPTFFQNHKRKLIAGVLALTAVGVVAGVAAGASSGGSSSTPDNNLGASITPEQQAACEAAFNRLIADAATHDNGTVSAVTSTLLAIGASPEMLTYAAAASPLAVAAVISYMKTCTQETVIKTAHKARFPVGITEVNELPDPIAVNVNLASSFEALEGGELSLGSGINATATNADITKYFIEVPNTVSLLVDNTPVFVDGSGIAEVTPAQLASLKLTTDNRDFHGTINLSVQAEATGKTNGQKVLSAVEDFSVSFQSVVDPASVVVQPSSSVVAGATIRLKDVFDVQATVASGPYKDEFHRVRLSGINGGVIKVPTGTGGFTVFNGTQVDLTASQYNTAVFQPHAETATQDQTWSGLAFTRDTQGKEGAGVGFSVPIHIEKVTTTPVPTPAPTLPPLTLGIDTPVFIAMEGGDFPLSGVNFTASENATISNVTVTLPSQATLFLQLPSGAVDVTGNPLVVSYADFPYARVKLKDADAHGDITVGIEATAQKPDGRSVTQTVSKTATFVSLVDDAKVIVNEAAFNSTLEDTGPLKLFTLKDSAGAAVGPANGGITIEEQGGDIVSRARVEGVPEWANIEINIPGNAPVTRTDSNVTLTRQELPYSQLVFDQDAFGPYQLTVKTRTKDPSGKETSQWTETVIDAEVENFVDASPAANNNFAGNEGNKTRMIFDESAELGDELVSVTLSNVVNGTVEVNGVNRGGGTVVLTPADLETPIFAVLNNDEFQGDLLFAKKTVKTQDQAGRTADVERDVFLHILNSVDTPIVNFNNVTMSEDGFKQLSYSFAPKGGDKLVSMTFNGVEHGRLFVDGEDKGRGTVIVPITTAIDGNPVKPNIFFQPDTNYNTGAGTSSAPLTFSSTLKAIDTSGNTAEKVTSFSVSVAPVIDGVAYPASKTFSADVGSPLIVDPDISVLDAKETVTAINLSAIPDGVTVRWSTNGGSTWTVASVSDNKAEVPNGLIRFDGLTTGDHNVGVSVNVEDTGLRVSNLQPTLFKLRVEATAAPTKAPTAAPVNPPTKAPTVPCNPEFNICGRR